MDHVEKYSILEQPVLHVLNNQPHLSFRTSIRRAIIDKQKSGGYIVGYKCNSPAPCPFCVVFTRSRKATANHFTVKEVSLNHGSCAGFPKPRRKDITRTTTATSDVTNHMQISASALQTQVKEIMGVDIPIRTAYRIINDIVELKYGLRAHIQEAPVVRGAVSSPEPNSARICRGHW